MTLKHGTLVGFHSVLNGVVLHWNLGCRRRGS